MSCWGLLALTGSWAIGCQWLSGVCVGPAERQGQAVQGDWPGQVSGGRAAAMGAEAGAEWSASVPTAGVQRLGSFLTRCAPGRGVPLPPLLYWVRGVLSLPGLSPALQVARRGLCAGKTLASKAAFVRHRRAPGIL